MMAQIDTSGAPHLGRTRGEQGPGDSDGKPVLEIFGGPGRVTRASLHELWLFRGVLWAFTVREVKVRYKQAAIGVGWAILQPLVAAAIFALFLGRYAGITSEDVPYFLFALAGMVPWTYFSNASLNGSQALVAHNTIEDTRRTSLGSSTGRTEILSFSAIAFANISRCTRGGL